MRLTIEFNLEDNPFPFFVDKAEVCDIVRVVFNPKGQYFSIYKKGGAMITVNVEKLESLEIDCEFLKGEKL